jgi:hypothetical protein
MFSVSVNTGMINEINFVSAISASSADGKVSRAKFDSNEFLCEYAILRSERNVIEVGFERA